LNEDNNRSIVQLLKGKGGKEKIFHPSGSAAKTIPRVSSWLGGEFGGTPTLTNQEHSGLIGERKTKKNNEGKTKRNTKYTMKKWGIVPTEKTTQNEVVGKEVTVTGGGGT